MRAGGGGAGQHTFDARLGRAPWPRRRQATRRGSCGSPSGCRHDDAWAGRSRSRGTQVQGDPPVGGRRNRHHRQPRAIETVNPAAEQMFGYAAGELVGRNINMLMPEPYRSQHDTYLAKYLATGRRQIIGIGREVAGLRKDGTTFPMHLSVGEFKIGEARYFTGTILDLSAQRAAEQRFEREQALFRVDLREPARPARHLRHGRCDPACQPVVHQGVRLHRARGAGREHGVPVREGRGLDKLPRAPTRSAADRCQKPHAPRFRRKSGELFPADHRAGRHRRQQRQPARTPRPHP